MEPRKDQKQFNSNTSSMLRSIVVNNNNNGTMAEVIDLTEEDMEADESIEERSPLSQTVVVDDTRMSDDDSDVVCLEDEDITPESSVCHFEHESLHLDWDTDASQYPLYHSNEDFKRLATPYIRLFEMYAEGCIKTCWRLTQRRPTIEEFWNYAMANCVPRGGWIGALKYVNPERRGWPLQHVTKAVVLVRDVIAPGQLSYNPYAEIEVLEADDPKFQEINSRNVPLWQIDPLRMADENADDVQLSYAGGFLEYIRDFYEKLYVPPEDSQMEELHDFVQFGLYQRLQLLFYMENQCHGEGQLSAKDRGRLVAAFKQYHSIKNAMAEIDVAMPTPPMPRLVNGISKETINSTDDLDEEERINSNKYVVLEMQLDRLKVELNFLKSSTLRHLIDDLSAESTDGSSHNYPYVLVMKEVSLSELPTIFDQLKEFVADPSTRNIRICTDLEQALRQCVKGASVFVTSGNYSISDIHNLSCGGSLIGIPTAGSDVTITPTDDIGDVWILYRGSVKSQLIIKNINFVIESDMADTNLSTCLQVTSGSLTVENVNFRNLMGNSSKDGFKLAKKSEKATLSSTNCNFTFEETYEKDETSEKVEEISENDEAATEIEDITERNEETARIEDITEKDNKDSAIIEDITEKDEETAKIEDIAEKGKDSAKIEDITEKDEYATEEIKDTTEKNEEMTEKGYDAESTDKEVEPFDKHEEMTEKSDDAESTDKEVEPFDKHEETTDEDLL